MGTATVAKGALLVWDRDLRLLIPRARKGLRAKEKLNLPLSISESKDLARKTRPFPIALAGARTSKIARRIRESLDGSGVQLAIPLALPREAAGLLLLGPRIDKAPFSEADLDVMEHMAFMIASSLGEDRARRRLADEVRRAGRQTTAMEKIYMETVHALAGVLDGETPGGAPGHSARVAALAAETGRRLGMSTERCEKLYLAGLLHDIGKQVIDRDILGKSGSLDEDEREIVSQHPEIAYDILSHIEFPWGDVAEVIRHHHERVDGAGYPDGIGGEEISVEAKILILAEAFDSMTSDQPWRKKLTFGTVIEELSKSMGMQFDVEVVAGLCIAVEEGLNGDSKYDEFLPNLASSGDPEIIQKMLKVLRGEIEACKPARAADIIEIASPASDGA